MPSSPLNPSEVQWDASPAAPAGPQIDPAAVAWDQPSDPREVNRAARVPQKETDDPVRDLFYPDVDFDTGLSFLDRFHLSQADNFAEKRLYLENVYGKSKVSVDYGPDGKPMLLVAQDGKKVAAEGGSKLKGFVAGLLGSAPELTGMAGGAAAGAEVGALGGPLAPITVPVGMIGGAAVGAAIGKGAEETGKALAGDVRQTPGELATHIGEAGKAGAVGELGGKLVGKTVSRLARGPLPKLITQTTPETDAMTSRALAAEARPQAESTMPGAKKIQFMQALARKVVSKVSKQDAANAQYIEGRMRAILKDAGIPEPQIDPLIKELASGDSKISTEAIGEHVKQAVTAHREMLEKNVEDRLTGANDLLNAQMKHLDALTRRYRTGELGVDVAAGVRSARADFGKAMSKVYDRVDQMVGDRALVPTNIIMQVAQKIAQRLPRTVQAPITGEMASLGKPSEPVQQLMDSLGIKMPEGKITFADAQRMRTILREKSDESALTRGVTQGEMAQLANAVDYSIQAAARDPAARNAVNMLNAADKLYASGIRKFNDSTVTRLVEDMKAGLPPDPQTVASRIVQSGYSARVKEIKKMLGPEIWRRVAGADYGRMLEAATDETGAVSGVQLLRQVTDRGALLKELHGDKLASEITELAKALATRDGKLAPQALRTGAVREALTSLHTAQEAEDTFMRKNALSLLANPKKNPEQVYSWLVRPDNGAALRSAVQLLGENSPQITQLRQAALKQLLSSAKMDVAEGKSESALLSALKAYSPEQQRMLFPNGLDSDLNLLGKEIQFVMRDLSDESKASFAAGAILSLPFPARLPLQVGISAYQVLLSQPSVIRYLSIGLRQPPGPARIAAREMLETLVRYGAVAPTTGSDAGAPPAPAPGAQPPGPTISPQQPTIAPQ